MTTVIDRVFIENFKVFKSFDRKLEKLAIIVGGRRSGKTSFVEALEILSRLMREAVVTGSIHRHWWGLENLAYRRRGDIRIGVGVRDDSYDIHGYFQATIDTREYRFVEEYHVSGAVAVVRDGVLTLRLPRRGEYKADESKRLAGIEELLEEEIRLGVTPWRSLIEFSDVNLRYWGSLRDTLSNAPDLLARALLSIRQVDRIQKLKVNSEYRDLLYTIIKDLLALAIITNYTLAKTTYIKWVDFKTTVNPVKDVFGYLRYDGSNLPGYIHRLLMSGSRLDYTNRMAELYCGLGSRIELIELPNKVTYLKAYCGGMELLPPNLPLGFVKSVVLGATLDTPTPLVVIDDFDEYLDEDLARKFIELAMTADKQVILTTRRTIYASGLPLENVVLLE